MFAKNLGICEATKDSSGVSSKKREKESAFAGCIWRSFRIGTAVARHCDIIGLQLRPLKDAVPELRHSTCLYRVRQGSIFVSWGLPDTWFTPDELYGAIFSFSSLFLLNFKTRPHLFQLLRRAQHMLFCSDVPELYCRLQMSCGRVSNDKSFNFWWSCPLITHTCDLHQSNHWQPSWSSVVVNSV